ncbi:hypothetical protein P3W43_03220 [Salinicola salarius]|uniref:hypothetical protein n=1 Tax=Salinicola salarius TaxID=430457 RepID=UPI0023E3C1AC|nr:hypothetical protein [Salinicola salarius]MDF3917866.1 hypothetical protein [Salinicola salarius]
MPSRATGVNAGSIYPGALSRQRVVHPDQYSGKPLLAIDGVIFPLVGASMIVMALVDAGVRAVGRREREPQIE